MTNHQNNIKQFISQFTSHLNNQNQSKNSLFISRIQNISHIRKSSSSQIQPSDNQFINPNHPSQHPSQIQSYSQYHQQNKSSKSKSQRNLTNNNQIKVQDKSHLQKNQIIQKENSKSYINTQSKKSLRFTQALSQYSKEQQPFVMTMKTKKSQFKIPNDSYYNDSLNYSAVSNDLTYTEMNTNNNRLKMKISFDSKIRSSSKKNELQAIKDEYIIPQDLRFGEQFKKQLDPNQDEDKIQKLKREVEQLKKKSNLKIQKDQEQIEEKLENQNYQFIQPKIQQNTQTLDNDHKKRLDTSKIQQSIQSNQSFKKRQVQTAKLLDKSHISSDHQKSFNILQASMQSKNYKLQQVKYKKKMLEQELKMLNQQIKQITTRKTQGTPKMQNRNEQIKNYLKKMIKISDDNQARQRAVNLVHKLKIEKKQRQRNMVNEFEKLDTNILSSINQLSKIRQQQQKKQKQKRKLDIINRMKQQQLRKMQQKKLKQQNKQFLNSIKPVQKSNLNTSQNNNKSSPPPIKQKQQILPIATPQLKAKKQKLHKLRNFQQQKKQSILQQYNSLLFKN